MVGLAAVATAQSPVSQPGSPATLTSAQAQKKLDAKSRRYTENVGQWNPQALFFGHAGQMDMWLTSKGVTYDFYRATKMKDGESSSMGQVVKMSFVGAHTPKSVGQDNVRFDTHFVSSTTGKTRVANGFAEVRQYGLYDGVDSRYYFDKDLPRYDLVVAPGANPRPIRMAFAGANSVKVSGNDILLGTNVGEQRQGKLMAYQVVDGHKVTVPAQFVQESKTTVAIKLGSYDKRRELIIDPLIYGSYYGGNNGFDEVHAVTSDSSGGTYMTGYTRSPDFPSIAGPYGFSLFGGQDAFITKLQGDAYSHDYAAIFGGAGNDSGNFIQVDPFGDVWVAGMTNSGNFPGGNLLFLTMSSNSNPNKGTFTISYPGVGSTTPLSYKATPNQVRTALEDLLGTDKIKIVDQLGPDSRLNTGGVYKIILPPEFGATPTVNSTQISPATTYAFSARQNAVFMMRWRQSSSEVLTPFPQGISYFAGEAPISVCSFKVIPNDNPNDNDPVQLNLAGNQSGDTRNTDIRATPVAGTSNGYIARYNFDRHSKTFVRVDALTKFVSSDGEADVDLSGMDVDRFGSIYVGGTIGFQGTIDTSVTPVFQTTNGVFDKGRLLRNNDLFVRKYTSNGNIAYSALVGGNGFDSAGGYDFNEGFAFQNTGSIVAVDNSLNLYITGVAGSFNYPRTRGVYGEVSPNDAPVVVVTKINPDASQIVYSTNLRTNGGNNFPAGIAVDNRGDAFITGNIHANFMTFPDSPSSDPTQAGDPNEPDGEDLGSIPITSDALDPTWETPGTPELTTSEGWLMVLNDSATDLLYSSYVGGILDDRVYAPYVDSFGDVWVSGYLDTHRLYFRPNSTGTTVNVREQFGSLPDALVTSLAFKRFPDTGGNQLSLTTLNGLWWTIFVNPFYTPFNWSATATPPGSPLPTVSATYQRDGFILKQRIGLASIDSVTLNPTTAPGGLGVQIIGTITLSQAAPVGGADVDLTLDNTSAATFTNGTGTTTINIPSGANTGTFTILTQPVQANTNVQVKATYQGSFKVAQFVVKPWLQDLALSPNSVVGGNNSSGRVTLAQPAPTGGVNVTLTTDTPSLISFPGGATVNVPEGQQSVVFTIATQGVSNSTFPTIRASLLDRGITRTLTLTQASLQALTFDPPRVAGGSPTTGTIALDGKAGSPFTVKLTINSGTTGYKFPKTLTFATGESSKTFTLTTAYEPVNTSRVVTVTRPAQGTYTKQSVKATIFVDFVGLTAFTITPSTINGGEVATGTVTLSSPAPAGGVVVDLKSSDPNAAVVPKSVTVDPGASVGSFDIAGQTVAVDANVKITASRGPKTIIRPLLVKGVTFTLSLNPTSVVGGVGSSTGTIVLSSAAPAGGVVINLKSSLANAQVPATLTISKGQTTGFFNVGTTAVNTTKLAHITATLGTNTAKADLEIRAVGVGSLTFNPSTVQGGNTVDIIITLEAAAPVGGATVHLVASNPSLFTNLPANVQFAQGQQTRTITVTTAHVTRTLATDVTATFGSSSVSGTLTVTR